MRLLNNQQIGQLLTITEAIRELDGVYRLWAHGQAMNTPRVDAIQRLPGEALRVYGFKQMGGAIQGGFHALRINSDVVQWPEVQGVRRRQKIPAANGRFVGLVLVFDVNTGMPQAIMPDGIIQQFRVAATNVLAARFLAPEENPVVCLLGSGWQAEAHALAIDIALHPGRIQVYSSNFEHCRAFCERTAAKVRAALVPCASSDAAAAGATAIFSATSAMSPTLHRDWVSGGRFFSVVKTHEVDAAFIEHMAQAFLHTRDQVKQQLVTLGEVRTPEGEQGWWTQPGVNAWPDLLDLYAGRVQGRGSQQDNLLFVNNVGLGIQFVALATRVLELAQEHGAGQILPDEWFTESEHP